MKTFHKFLILFIILLLNAQLVFPQWVKINGLSLVIVNCFAVSGTNLFAGTNVASVWKRPSLNLQVFLIK
jgi:hypothetical protein